jgi:outer membrane immunogenic protein
MWFFGDSFLRRYRAISRDNLKLTASVVAWDTPKGKKAVKKILLTTTALLALGIAPAAAADLAARPYTKAPAAIAINNWGGFYLGAMGGYAQENSSGIGTLSGGFAGGTAGYNWQTGALVLGVEVDGAWADIGTTLGAPGIATLEYTSRATGSVRCRIGYAFDSVLLYGTGGWAWSDNRMTATVVGLGSASDSQFHSGWAVGAGVEVMFAPKWSVKAEYLYKSLESANYFSGTVPGGIASGTINLNSVQVGVNYHF